MTTGERAGAVGLVASVCAISGLHFVVSPQADLVHEVLGRLYYVPIVVAAIRYGTLGGLATSLLASALYLPHIVMTWSGGPLFGMDEYAAILLFNVVGLVTGGMADRIRLERNRSRRAAEEVERAYAKLAASSEARLKAERLATVGRIAAGMAHEIRTPLGALLGCCEILSAGIEPPDTKAEFVDIAKKAIARIERLVEAFLEFAHPPPADLRSVDLNELAEDVTHLVVPALLGRPLDGIDLRLFPAPLPVTVDRHQVERAVVELLLVASSQAREGGLTVSTARRGRLAEIAVHVAPFEGRLSGDVFEPFADNDLADGLTLSVVKRLVENQAGSVDATVVDRCLRFVIALPSSRTAATGTTRPPATPTYMDAQSRELGA